MKNKFSKEICRLAESLKEIQEQADKLGMFTDTRELLKCEKCGLMEDVTFDSKLITYIAPNNTDNTIPEDSGHRFKATDDPVLFLCPLCGSSVVLPEFDGSEK